MTEPDRIWINDKWEAYLRPTFDGDTSGYVRADLADPAAMTPEVRALMEAAKSGLRFIENTESELSIVLGCGDALRAALAALRAGGDA